MRSVFTRCPLGSLPNGGDDWPPLLKFGVHGCPCDVERIDIDLALRSSPHGTLSAWKRTNFSP